MGVIATAPAATIVDNRAGGATSIDAKVYDALKAFLRALGAAYTYEEDADVRLTTGQAAQIVGTSARTIARLCGSGRLKGTRVGSGRRFVMLSELMEFDHRSIEERGTRPERMRGMAAKEGFYGNSDVVSEYFRSCFGWAFRSGRLST